jgi:hypothetical protein
MRLTARDVEIAVARHFGWRQNLIVPNVSWGFSWGRYYHEADLLVIRPSGYLIEVEIKVTASDIKADRNKGHMHASNKVRELWFAVPSSLADNPNIPERAGILSVPEVHWNENNSAWVKTMRPAKRNPQAERVTAEDRLRLLELAAMRIWTLKTHLANRRIQEGK